MLKSAVNAQSKERVRKRSSSLSTAASPEAGSTINVGKVTPAKVFKVNQEGLGPKYYLCLIPCKRGRYGWRQDVYWLHHECLSAQVTQAGTTKLEQNAHLDEEILSSKQRGFQTVLPDGIDLALRDVNFKIAANALFELSNKSLQFEAKELDHLSRLSEGTEHDENENQEDDEGTQFKDERLFGELSQNGSSVAGRSPKKQSRNTTNKMLEETQDESFLGKRPLYKSQNPSVRQSKNHPASESKFTKTAHMQEELLTMAHLLKPKLEQAPFPKDFDEIYPRTMSDLRHFEVIGVSGVNHFNDEKYHSVVLKHKTDSTMRVMRILTAEELAAILETN